MERAARVANGRWCARGGLLFLHAPGKLGNTDWMGQTGRLCQEFFFCSVSLRCVALTMGPRGKLHQERLGGWFAWVHEVCPLCFWRCHGKMANKSLLLEIWAQQLQKSMVLLLVLFLIGPGTGCWLKLVLSWQSYKLRCVLSSTKCWETPFLFLTSFQCRKVVYIHAVDSASWPGSPWGLRLQSPLQNSDGIWSYQDSLTRIH